MRAVDKVLTVSEAAQLIGLSSRQVQRLCKSGKLEHRDAAGVYLIEKSSIQAYKEQSQSPS